MSLSGAILILVVTVIRALTINKLPKKLFLVLWDIVLIRLLIPFSIPSAFSIYSVIDRSTAAKALSGTAGSNVFYTGLSEQFSAVQDMQHLSENQSRPVSIGFMVWCIGMIIFITFFTVSYLHSRFYFRTSLPIHNDYVEQWVKEHPLKRSISVRQSKKFSTPLTYGIFHPVILMPQATNWENTAQLKYVLFHEYVHIC